MLRIRASWGRAAIGLVLLAVSVLAGMPRVTAQDASAERLSTDYIPPSGLAVVYGFPKKLLASPDMRLMPTEVARAWTKENFGVDLMDVESIKVIVGVPGPSGPPVAAVFSLAVDVDVSSLESEMFATDPVSIDGYQAIPLRDTPDLVLHQADSRTLVVATANYLAEVVGAKEGSGSLAEFVSGMSPMASVMVAMVMEPVREQVNGLAQQIPPQVPPPLAALTELPKQVTGIAAAGGLSLNDPIRLVIVGNSEADAQSAEQIINNALEFGRSMAVAQAMSEMDGEGQVAEAMRQYIDRMGNEIVAMLTPQRSGKRLMIKIENQTGLMTSGMMAGLLLPAVQGARGAAQRMSSQNDLKQLMLAMFNYEAVYGHFPDNIRADDGTPLLSWRVAILPFLEANDLYEQFHLDEPWDSDHNFKLLEQMPQVFVADGIPTAPGNTIYQRPVGESLGFKPDGPTKLREVTDGLSNTIGLFEASSDFAVPWTAPDEAEIDMEWPLNVMGSDRPEGFNAAMMDGSVRFISYFIDEDTLKALLTRNGGEVVGRF